MPKIIDNPPSPENLIENIRQFSDYTLSGALADLIDNSIYGNAKKIEIIAADQMALDYEKSIKRAEDQIDKIS